MIVCEQLTRLSCSTCGLSATSPIHLSAENVLSAVLVCSRLTRLFLCCPPSCLNVVHYVCLHWWNGIDHNFWFCITEPHPDVHYKATSFDIFVHIRREIYPFHLGSKLTIRYTVTVAHADDLPASLLLYGKREAGEFVRSWWAIVIYGRVWSRCHALNFRETQRMNTTFVRRTGIWMLAFCLSSVCFCHHRLSLEGRCCRIWFVSTVHDK